MLRATATSRTQHVVLRKLADELSALLDAAVPFNDGAVRDVLARIGGALKRHTEMELEVMYPQLLEHPDAEIRALAAKTIPLIKDVYDGFVTFQGAWTTERIRSNPDNFVKQARFVIEALHQSTAHEEEALYSRVDAAIEALALAKKTSE